MTRYQCPRCHRIHRHEDTPACSIHGRGSARGCAECEQMSILVPCPSDRRHSDA